MKQLLILFLSVPAMASNRAIMEGIRASNNAIFVDTVNVQVGIATGTIGATLSVGGSLDVTTGIYKAGGTPGISLNCSAGNTTINQTVSSGIVTSGSCSGGGVGDVLKASTQTFTGFNTFLGSTTFSGFTQFKTTVQVTAPISFSSSLTATGYTNGMFHAGPSNILNVVTASTASINITGSDNAWVISFKMGITAANSNVFLRISSDSATAYVWSCTTTGSDNTNVLTFSNGGDTQFSIMGNSQQILSGRDIYGQIKIWHSNANSLEYGIVADTAYIDSSGGTVAKSAHCGGRYGGAAINSFQLVGSNSGKMTGEVVIFNQQNP